MGVMAAMGVGMRQKRAIQRAHGEFNAVVRAGFAHKSADMGFDGAFFDAQVAGDFAV